jgi:hypothetical protein
MTLLRAVRVDGRVLYATCSLGADENDGVVEKGRERAGGQGAREVREPLGCCGAQHLGAGLSLGCKDKVGLDCVPGSPGRRSIRAVVLCSAGEGFEVRRDRIKKSKSNAVICYINSVQEIRHVFWCLIYRILLPLDTQCHSPVSYYLIIMG